MSTDSRNSEDAVDFEDALTYAGTGKFQHKVVLVGACCLACSYMSSAGMSYVLPAAQCDLQMDSKDKGYLVSAFFLGLVLSCHWWGFLSDTHGRQYVLTRCLLADGLLYLITSITPNFLLILIWRIFNGFLSCGGVVSIYAYVGEFHSNKTRARALMFMSLLSISNLLILPVVAWLILPGKWSFTLYPGLTFNSWRLYYLCNGLPSLFCSALLYSLPESPKFLLANEQSAKALAVLQRIHKENHKERDHKGFLVENVVLNEPGKIKRATKNVNKVDAFFSLMWNQTVPLLKPPHRLNIILVCLVQYLVFFVNGGFFIWLPESINRLEMFRNDFGDKLGTYCDSVEYKRIKMQFNATKKDLFIGSNSSLKDSTKFLDQDDTQQRPSCSNDIDFMVYIYLEIFGFCMSLCMALCVLLTSYFDKKYVFVFVITLTTVGSVCLLIINVTSIIPIVANVFGVLSGVCIPISSSIFVDLFPTNMRAMASCFGLMFSRIGTISGNAIFGELIDAHCNSLIWCSIIALIVCNILMIQIPKKPQYLLVRCMIEKKTIETSS